MSAIAISPLRRRRRIVPASSIKSTGQIIADCISEILVTYDQILSDYDRAEADSELLRVLGMMLDQRGIEWEPYLCNIPQGGSIYYICCDDYLYAPFQDYCEAFMALRDEEAKSKDPRYSPTMEETSTIDYHLGWALTGQDEPDTTALVKVRRFLKELKIPISG